MSRRTRAMTFLLLALAAAALAAGIADGYGSRVAQGYGPLRPVVVAAQTLKAGKALRPRDIAGDLDVRRVPAQFIPPATLQAPAEALGLVPVGDVAAGSYLVGNQLRPPRRDPVGESGLGPARRPVEISVSGAEALLATGVAARGSKVDVIVTTEPSSGGRGHTYVAATAVPLLALGPGADGSEPGGSSAATLALTKAQALRLIAAESFARKLTLLPGG